MEPCKDGKGWFDFTVRRGKTENLSDHRLGQKVLEVNYRSVLNASTEIVRRKDDGKKSVINFYNCRIMKEALYFRNAC